MTAALLDARAEAVVREHVSGLERATGVEAVVAVIERADSYPEIPWKAFALGTSVAAITVVVAAVRAPGWEAFEAVVEAAVVVLSSGAAAALASMWIAPFARMLLPQARLEAEVLQYAQAMFLEAGLSKTSGRNGILMLVSLFEHQVAVVADHGIRGKLAQEDFDAAVSAVTAQLKRRRLEAALAAGLSRLEQALLTRGFRRQAGAPNEVPDSVMQRREGQ